MVVYMVLATAWAEYDDGLHACGYHTPDTFYASLDEARRVRFRRKWDTLEAEGFESWASDVKEIFTPAAMERLREIGNSPQMEVHKERTFEYFEHGDGSPSEFTWWFFELLEGLSEEDQRYFIDAVLIKTHIIHSVEWAPPQGDAHAVR